MSTIDRAAEVIDNALSKDSEVYLALFGDEHVAIAQALADEGLLAADTLEYGVEYTGVNHGHRHTGSNASWHAKRKHAEMEYRQMAKSGMNPRLVARRVSRPWEVTDE